ncbi:hypothetical protein ABZ403_04480 [Micromonospora zamorensis]|uniref:hypothetical protein n=1 Tax=Micromonospora zamorensis TaxID=709883 RepID=UPI0033F31B81
MAAPIASAPSFAYAMRPRRKTAPDRGVDVHDLRRKDVPCHDPIQGLSDDLFVGEHGGPR